MQNTKLIRRLFSGLFPLLMLTFLASCQKENPVVLEGPQSAAKVAVGDYEKKPASVRKPSATNITHSSARIEWKKASRAEEYIVLRRALYADNPESSLHPVHRTSGLSYDDTGLVPQTEYIYRIVARNKAGDANRSPHVKFRTLPEPEAEEVVREEEEVAAESIPEEGEVSAEFIPEEEEVSVEFIPEEEEEPLEADAAHVDGSCGTPGKVGNLQVTNGGFNDDGDYVVVLHWDEADNANIYRVDRLNVTDPDPDGDGLASPVTLEEFPETNTYEDGDVSPNTTYVYRVYPSHKCLIDEEGYYPWSRGARSHSVSITTPDFSGLAFSPPTPGCPENRQSNGDITADYPGNITTCGNLTLTSGEAYGTLSHTGDHDWYRVDLEEGKYLFEVSMDVQDGAAVPDERFVVLSGLYDYRGMRLPGWRNFSQNTGEYDLDTKAEFTVEKGTYFFDIHAMNRNSGAYSLFLSDVPD